MNEDLLDMLNMTLRRLIAIEEERKVLTATVKLIAKKLDLQVDLDNNVVVEP